MKALTIPTQMELMEGKEKHRAQGQAMAKHVIT